MTAYENHSSKVTHTHPQVQLRQGQDVTINLTVFQIITLGLISSENLKLLHNYAMPWGHFSPKVSTILCERAIEITVGCYMGHKCTITTRVVSNLLNNCVIFAVHT